VIHSGRIHCPEKKPRGKESILMVRKIPEGRGGEGRGLVPKKKNGGFLSRKALWVRER